MLRRLAVVCVFASSVAMWAPSSPVHAGAANASLDARPTAARISGGIDTTCVVTDAARVSCWGSDSVGQLGNGAGVAGSTESGALVTLPSPTTALAVDVGDYHVCALLTDGKITCWGNGGDALGDGVGVQLDTPPAPITLPSPGTAISVAAGYAHTCAVLTNGAVTCWGDDFSGQLGNGAGDINVSTPPAPVVLPGTGAAVAVAAGSEHTCALLTDGKVACWGYNPDGQVGVGSSSSQIDSPTLVTLPGATTALAIDAGDDHTCAVLAAGGVTCWGSNASGQLGIGVNGGDADVPAAIVSLPASATAVAVATGEDHTCVVLSDAAVSCWGSNHLGQLGQPVSIEESTSPSAPIVGVGAASALATGSAHTCVIERAGGVRCWGSDSAGQIGSPSNREPWQPTEPFSLPGGEAAVQVEAGEDHACARTASAATTPLVACWGDNLAGALGNGTTTDANAPTATSPLPGSAAAIGLATGDSFSCARLTGQQVTCWGSDTFGRLGNGSSGSITAPPAAVTLPSPGTATRLATGDAHACVVLTGGNVSCWGDDFYGALGNGAGGAETSPPAGFSAGAPATAIDGGADFTCALLNTDQVTCWGDDGSGQLGNGAAGDQTSPPAAITLPAPGTANRIATGWDHACAVLTDGKITCWGRNFEGQLGSPALGSTVTTPPSPVVLPSPGTASDVTAGFSHTCALLTDGKVACWGRSDASGVNTSSFSVTSPTLVTLPSPGTASSISAGQDFTCAVLTDGMITCWGTDLQGQAGDGATEAGYLSAPSPLLVFPGQTVTPTLSLATRTPVRLLETRVGVGLTTVDGQFQGGGERAAGSTLTLQVTGRAGIPTTATAVSLNVTIAGASQQGFVTVYACDVARPTASNVNYSNGLVVANAVLSDLSATGTVCLYTHGATHLVVDLNGVFPSTTGFRALTPARLLETRSGAGLVTVDGQFQGIGARTGGTTLELLVRGRGGVPTTATTVALNVTVAAATNQGFITVYPCGTARPTASNVNYLPGATVAAAAISGLSSDGKVCIYAHGTTHLIVDVNGAMVPGSAFTSPAPRRLLETRAGAGLVTYDGQFQGIGARTAGQVTELQISGRSGVDARTRSVVLTVTAVTPSGQGFLTVYPCGTARPNASNLNHRIGVTIANSVVSGLSSDGKVCIYTHTATDLIVDLAGTQLVP